MSIRVWIDPIRLAANDLTIKEVENAIRGENISLPAGTLEADNIDLTLNLDNAANDIRERVARVVDNLPSESDPPQILKRAAGFTTTMWLSLSSSTWSDLELGDYAER